MSYRQFFFFYVIVQQGFIILQDLISSWGKTINTCPTFSVFTVQGQNFQESEKYVFLECFLKIKFP